MMSSDTENVIMRNDYESAIAIELGSIQHSVLGEKNVGNLDIITSELGTRFIESSRAAEQLDYEIQAVQLQYKKEGGTDDYKL